MPPTTSSPIASGWRRSSGLVLPIVIIGAILVFVIPIPPGLLDVSALGQFDACGGGAAHDPGDPVPSGIQCVSDHSADHDADPAGPQRGDDPTGPDSMEGSTGWMRPAG